MSDATIPPALTPEEWAAMTDTGQMVLPGHGGDVQRLPDGGLAVFPNGEGAWLHGGDLHIVAAQCLYGQPFGFTRADSDLLSDAAGRIVGEDHAQRQFADALMALAERIDALLPPES